MRQNRLTSALLAPALGLVLLATACSGHVPEPSVAHATPSASPSVEMGESGPILKEAAIPGLDVGVSTTESKDLQVNVRWAIVPGADALNRAVEGFAKEREAAFRAEAKPADTAPPELSVTSTPFLAKGEVAGVRVAEAVFYGANWGHSARTFYGAANGGWVASGAELFTEEGAVAAFKALVAALPRADQEMVAALTDRTRLLNDTIVQADGSLLIAVDQGLIAPSSTGTMTAVLPAAKVRSWISPRGRDVVIAATKGGAYAVGSAPAEPSLSAAPPSIAPPAPTSPESPTTGGGAVDCATAKCVALTYDDGPGRYTGQLLDHLKAAGVPATLFVVGANVERLAPLLQRAQAQGIEIGNHTWSHRDLAKLTPDQQAGEVNRTADAIQQATGSRPKVLRPPYGSLNQATRGLGYAVVNWDIDTEDWKNRDVATTTQRALAGVQTGSIVLMHDIHASSVQATPGIIAELKNRGFTLVTLDQLLGTPQAGTLYYSRNRTG